MTVTQEDIEFREGEDTAELSWALSVTCRLVDRERSVPWAASILSRQPQLPFSYAAL